MSQLARQLFAPVRLAEQFHARIEPSLVHDDILRIARGKQDGDIGLQFARLARHGVDCRIIDKNSGPGQASRAMAVHARTLEFYQQLGFADELNRVLALLPAQRQNLFFSATFPESVQALAQSLLGWSAKRGIDEMCADAWRWQSANPEGYPD